MLTAHGTALNIDCHSFPASCLPYEDQSKLPRPEICIGTDPFHSPDRLRDSMVAAFKDLGYTVDVDFPFSGAITPIKHYGQDSRVHSIMIEVRRDLFAREVTVSPRYRPISGGLLV